MLEPLKELLFPVHCFGCHEIGLAICSKCRREWNPHFYSKQIDGLTICSAITYGPVARSILLSAKEDGVKIADELIIEALLKVIREIPNSALRNAIFVPIPASRRSRRKRGRDFILELVKAISIQTKIPFQSGIEIKRALLDQSGLDLMDRKRNISNAFSSVLPIENDVILIDDLVTTGATLLEARRALNVVKTKVRMAITACVAPTPTIRG